MKAAVFFCLVLLVICDQVLCYFINVTRDDQDRFILPDGINPGSDGSFDCNQVSGARPCTCRRLNSTFSTSGQIKCVRNLDIRNKTKSGDWVFLLRTNHGAESPIKVVDLVNKSGKIKFRVNIDSTRTVKLCSPVDMERRKNFTWEMVDSELHKKADIRPQKGREFQLNVNSTEAKKLQKSNVGSIVRVRIQCTIKPQGAVPKQNEYTFDDYLFFKIPGIIQVEISDESSEVSSSIISKVSSSYPDDNVSAPTSAHSFPIHSLSSSSATVYSTSIGPYEHSRSTPVLNVITMQTNEPQSIKPSTSFEVMSSMDSSVSQIMSSSVLPNTLLPDSISTAQASTYNMVPFPSSMSSSPTRNKAMLSDDTPTGGIVGGALGGLVILVFAVLLIAFCLKKYQLSKSSLKSGTACPGGKDSSLIYENPGQVPLPTLSNPVFQEGSYENPEDVHFEDKKQSGVNSIESAAYDRFLIVENPYARDEIAKSVYDNVPEEQYKALDLMKRDPSAKYQSLLKPGSEYTTVADSTPSSGLLQEPVYSVVDDKAGVPAPSSSPNGQPNEGAGVTEEPVYNVLDIDDTNIPEQAAEPVYNILKQSTKSEGAREPVYSVLEDEALERSV